MNVCNRLICILADNVNCSMLNIFCFRSCRRYAGGCTKHNSRQKWGRRRWSYESLRAASVQLLLAVGVNHGLLTACGLGMRVAFLTPWCRSSAIRWETEKSCGCSPQQTTLPSLGEYSNPAGHLSQTRAQLEEIVTKLQGQAMKRDIWHLMVLLLYTVF